MIDLLNPAIESNQRSQQEYDMEFDQLVQHLVVLNTELDTAVSEIEGRTSEPTIFETDLQAEHVEALRQLRDELLSEILKEPARAFSKEYDLLQMLYEGRTLTYTDSLGTVVSEFVTRDPSRQKADLHFRQLDYESGNIERVVEVPRREDESAPFLVSMKNDELRLAATVYSRGMNQRVEIDPESPHGKHMLVEFFTHSITASDLMFNRLPDEITQADMQARDFLRRKRSSYNG